MKTIVILGTAREESNTLAAIAEVCPFADYELIDLRTLRIEPYNYSGPEGADDFLLVAQKMEVADRIVFATPVYWYSMSHVLKNFFDRLTDLLSTYKTIGKALKGKSTYLISTGTDRELPEGFEVPFRLTSDYFDMKYEKSFYKVIK
jgi:multimeric flavodoxin WrbA